MIFTSQSEPNRYGTQIQPSPTAGEVVKASSVEAFTGVGSAVADRASTESLSVEGQHLTYDQFQESSNYRSGFQYDDRMTDKRLEILARRYDSQKYERDILGRATTGQKVLSFVTELVVGVAEPKNLLSGIAARPILGLFGPAVRDTSKAIKVRRANSELAAKLGMGAKEGLVAAAITEPSNRYSADTLQEDYGMGDSLLNIGTSTILGGLIHATPEITRAIRNRGQIDPMIKEFDVASSQVMAGQKIDTTHVERVGEISTKPVAEKAAAVEQFVRYTETPEFKTKFEGSKVVDEQGQPLRGYRGRRSLDNAGREAIFFTDNPDVANTYSASMEYADVPNTQIAYFNMNNPLEVDAKGFDWHSIEFNGKIMDSDEIAAYAKRKGHDGVIIKNVVDDLNAERSYGDTSIAVFSENQIISAFGADDMDAIAKRIDAENAAAVNKSVARAISPENDTAIDFDDVRSLDDYQEQLELQKHIDELQKFDAYMDEIAAMRRDGVLSDAQIAKVTDAVNAIDEKDLITGWESALTCLTRG